MKGFVSILFLFLVSETLMSVASVEHFSFRNDSSNGLPEVLGSKRIELENSIDEIIREELFLGLLLHQPGEKIKSSINSRIISHLNGWKKRQDEAATYEIGFAALEQTNYLSLLQGEMEPLTKEKLDEATHILVLPVDEENAYGEYTYTGGWNGTNILVVRMRAPRGETLFALPSGHRTCSSTLLPILPCVG